MIVNLEKKDSLFYGKEDTQSSMLPYALNSGNFVCVTTSGTVRFIFIYNIKQIDFDIL